MTATENEILFVKEFQPASLNCTDPCKYTGKESTACENCRRRYFLNTGTKGMIYSGLETRLEAIRRHVEEELTNIQNGL